MAKKAVVKSKPKPTVKAAKKTIPRAEKKIEKKSGKKKVVKNEEEEKPEKVKVKLVDTKELAAFVGVDVRRIQQLTQDGIIKKEPGGKYDFVRAVHALIQYYRQKSDNRRSNDSEEMAGEKIKQINVKRRLEELKLAQLEGELHKAEDLERIIGAMLTRLRINLLAFSKGLGPILREMDDAMEISEKIDERIRRALNEVTELDLRKLVVNEQPGEEVA